MLDIGFGVGAYTLAFASRCAEVTALDMEPSSISILQESAAQYGLNNVTCQEGMWENYRPDRTFSFVFTSMCPAIWDFEALRRMELLSVRARGIIDVTHDSYDLHQKHLMELLDVRSPAGMTTEALWYYESLYLAGKLLNVRSWSNRYIYDTSMEEVCRINEIYFEIFGIPAEESRRILRAYFSSQAKDGLVPDKTRLNAALVSWSISY